MPPTGGKKPFSQSMPEPALEPIQGSAIVVIHPGSNTLRFGRAADTFPHELPHCVARRHKHPGKQPHYEDPILLRPNDEHSQAETLRVWGLKHACQALSHKTTSMGDIRETTTEEQLRDVNDRVKPEITDVLAPTKWTDTTIKRDFLIGDEALYVKPDDHYDIHWPIRQGRFNLHNGPGGSLSAVLQDLETIWNYAIQNFLGIPLKDLKHYRAVLMIPDLYNRTQVREMMSLLLERIGFSAAFVVQESICATFGCGISSACVVDIGDQKTAISCVEDGLSQKKTRLLLEYGGRDITRCFYWLLKRAGFPYRDCDMMKRSDALLLQELKKHHTCLDKDTYGLEQKHIQVRHPRQPIMKYTFYMGDERFLAPMALFYPNMIGLIGTKVCKNVQRYKSDPTDPLDEDYLMQTMSKHEQAARLVALRKKESATAAEQSSQNDTQIEDDSVPIDDDDTTEMTEGAAPESTPGGGISKLLRKIEEEEEGVDISEGLMGLDEAICRSIDRCESDEMKRRMFSCVLVVGGGFMFRGAAQWLAELLWVQMPPHIRLSLETTDIVLQPKDVDPKVTCWKGGTILCCLDTAQELWIRQGEWKRHGVRVLRERAAFVW